MKKISHLLLIITLLLPALSQAQLKIGLGAKSGTGLVDINYADPKEYEIAEIKVSGSKFYDGNSMINISNLKVGDKVKVPGPQMTDAVKKLMDQGILEEVSIEATRVEFGKIWLLLKIKERPRLYKVTFAGLKKGEQESLNEKIKIYKGKLISETLIKNTKLAIQKFFYEKGYLNVTIKSTQQLDTNRGNNAVLRFAIAKKNKVRIDTIIFTGRTKLAEASILSQLKGTKSRTQSGLFASSKFVPKKYDEDKQKLLDYYNKNGYRDARILSDSVIKLKNGNLAVVFNLDEGNQYHYRKITWEGNYIRPDTLLTEILGLKKGDVYNPEDLEKRMSGNPVNDVSSVYMDDGYLFYNADPQEIALPGDSIDLVIRIHEGKQAIINKVSLNGNTKTSDHVVLREIRTLPGQKFSKSAIIRTVRELSQLGYFNPEKINPVPIPQNDGTVNIEYNVEEKPSDQIELSGGWGGYIGFVGTLGIVFNNFSAKSIGDLSKWRPLPAGDGQKLALRFQANGAQFQNFSLTFTEPWFGGKKPNSLSISLAHSIYNTVGRDTYAQYGQSPFSSYNPYGNYGSSYGSSYGGSQYGSGYGIRYNPDDTTNGHFNTTSLTVSLGKRLKWPDDYFTGSVALSLSRYDIAKFLGSYYPEGITYNASLIGSISRNSIDNPTFPRQGSSFSLTATFTPPYSLFTKKSTTGLLEYHKWMFGAAWYTPLIGKFVLQTRAHLGFLGRYDSGRDFVPIERFIMGGSGISGTNFSYGGVEFVGLRGYADRSIITSTDGKGGNGVVYNKFVVEVRYPISLNPSATIFGLIFAEGGNNWNNFSDYNPFQLYRSAGIGVRIFMPAFGMLGFDFGKGFDPIKGKGLANDGLSSFTFTIGQQIR